MTTETLADIARCAEWASVVNPQSPNRKALRRLLVEHDLEIAALLSQPIVRALVTDKAA